MLGLDDDFEASPRFIWASDELNPDDLLTWSQRYDSLISESERRLQVKKIMEVNRDPVRREITKAFVQYDEESLYSSSNVRCFTRGLPSQKHWYYYGSKGAGYALMFDFAKPWHLQMTVNEAAEHFRPLSVRYQDTRPSVRLSMARQSSEEHLEALCSALYTKSRTWDDQNEFRFARIGIGAGHVEFPDDSLCGVAYGYNIDRAQKERIRSILQLRARPLTEYETRKAGNTFDIELGPIGSVRP